MTRTFRRPKREAENELNRLLTEVGAGEHAAANATVGELVAKWIAHRG